jgi:double-GTPase-like protein
MTETAEQPATVPTLRLHSGLPLKASEVPRVTRREYTPIIFLAGAIDSGKTTLLGSIHDAFQFGPLSGYSFAGSETLMGFEERCFESRVRSGRETPHTPRTQPQEGQEFFHLRLRKGPSELFRELLFADMSGEFYERAIKNAAELREKEFETLPRCDYFLLLLDGEKLLDLEQRQDVRRDGLTFLRRCQEAKLLRPETVLQVMISKWDIVAGKPEDEQKSCKNFVASRFQTDVLHRDVEVLEIASRPDPHSEGIAKLFGVKDVFPRWVEAIPAVLRSNDSQPCRPAGKKMFNRITM